jgi:hypothetical protein
MLKTFLSFDDCWFASQHAGVGPAYADSKAEKETRYSID